MTKKYVRLVVNNNTDGTDKIEIGTAEVEELPNGDMMVDMTITDPKVIEQLGGESIRGVIPRWRVFKESQWKHKE